MPALLVWPQEQLARLDDLQQRHDVLERKLAALEHRAPHQPSNLARLSADGGEPVPAARSAPSAVAAPEEPGCHGDSEDSSYEAAPTAAAALASAATTASGSRPYRVSDYGGRAAPAAAEGLEAQLLERDVRLFDLTLVSGQGPGGAFGALIVWAAGACRLGSGEPLALSCVSRACG